MGLVGKARVGEARAGVGRVGFGLCLTFRSSRRVG